MLIDFSAASAQLNRLAAELKRWQRLERRLRLTTVSLSLGHCGLALGTRWYHLTYACVGVGLVALAACLGLYAMRRAHSAAERFDREICAYGRAVGLVREDAGHFVDGAA